MSILILLDLSDKVFVRLFYQSSIKLYFCRLWPYLCMESCCQAANIKTLRWACLICCLIWWFYRIVRQFYWFPLVFLLWYLRNEAKLVENPVITDNMLQPFQANQSSLNGTAFSRTGRFVELELSRSWMLSLKPWEIINSISWASQVFFLI